ncbi:MAG TPA: hypothetical protein VMN78_00260 [Longimicrobiales bacterium]|nr:hypothetical protein [Longimicrobiales bacterium]
MGMGRTAAAVLAGAVTWAALWVGGTTAATAAWPDQLPAGVAITHIGVLAGYIAYSVALSVLAGYVASAVGAMRGVQAVRALAVLQLLLGIGFEASAWSLTPVWYHLVFLALIVPATLYGGRLRQQQYRRGSCTWHIESPSP